MFGRLLCIAVKSCSLSEIPLSRYYSQTIVPLTKTLTRSLSFTRNAPFSPLSKLRVSNLSCSICKHEGAILTKASSKNFVPVRRNNTGFDFDIDTNVLNNVYLYKYDRPIYFKSINGFAVFQLLFWIGICYYTCKQLPSYDSKDFSLKKYCLDNFFDLLIAVVAVLAGVGCAILVFAFTARSARYIILHKGGENVTLVTYHPLSNKSVLTVPIKKLECRANRKEMKNFLPMRMEGRWFFYILDSDGEFVNPKLFDYTVGTLKSPLRKTK